MLQFWRTVWEDQTEQAGKVDLGNGRFLSAEDVLDGHFHRLSSTTVSVQVKQDLHHAIEVLAPDLSPLTEIAEEVVQIAPPAQPTPQFRDTLHKALEQTHRQHQAQRILGTRIDKPEPVIPWTMAALLVLVVAALFGATAYLARRRAVQRF
ncbi:MAG: hypothetical protein R3C14_17425 [Caldilineaceae bacterium]